MRRNPNRWLRQQVWHRLWTGPAAVAGYLWLPIQLACVPLSALCSPELAGPSRCVLAATAVLWGVILPVDNVGACRNHHLGALRFSAARSRRRIEKLGIRSRQVERFMDALWLDPALTGRFRRTRVASVELLVEALDRLSRMASRYGPRGKKVFEANQGPIGGALGVLEGVPWAEAEGGLIGPLEAWLAHPPEFDPEGWALELFRGNVRDAAI